jgi:DNA/RNA-binding domain of Phe-tRNA-synthetase-like protein
VLLDPRLTNLGAHLRVAKIIGVCVRSGVGALERLAGERCQQLDPTLANQQIARYRAWNAGVNPDQVPSPAWLWDIFQRRGRLPRINSVVDAYNLASLESGIVLSAHDLSVLEGPIRWTSLDKPVHFEPLGGEDHWIPAGEWCVRDAVHALCRMNTKQSRRSSIGLGTTEVLLYAQGAPGIDAADLERALEQSSAWICEFSGGSQIAGVRYEVMSEQSDSGSLEATPTTS